MIKTRRNPNCNCRFKGKRNTSKTAILPIYWQHIIRKKYDHYILPSHPRYSKTSKRKTSKEENVAQNHTGKKTRGLLMASDHSSPLET